MNDSIRDEIQRKFEEITPPIKKTFINFISNIRKKTGKWCVVDAFYGKWKETNPPAGLHSYHTWVDFIHGFSFTWITPQALLKVRFHFYHLATFLGGKWDYITNTGEFEVSIKWFHKIRNIHIAETKHHPLSFVEKVLLFAENVLLSLLQDFLNNVVGEQSFKTLGGMHRYASHILLQRVGGKASDWVWRAIPYLSSCPEAGNPKEKVTSHTHYYINIIRLSKPGVTLNLPFVLVFEEAGKAFSVSFEKNAISVSPFKVHLLTGSQPLIKINSSLALYYQSFYAGVLSGELCACASPKEVEEKVKNAVESLFEMLSQRLEKNPLFPLYTLAFSCIYTLFFFLRGNKVKHFEVKPPHFKNGAYTVDVILSFMTANNLLFNVFVSVTKSKKRRLRAYVACRQMEDTYKWVLMGEEILDGVESGLESVKSAVKSALKNLAHSLKEG